jgi:iron complex outermembrane receptor protein
MLLAGAAMLSFASSAAYAQAKQHFRIPASDAGDAVQNVAQQSGLQVLAPDADLRGVRTNPIDGDYSPIDALRRMLAGHGLEVVAGQDGIVTIRRATVVGQAETPADPLAEDIVVTGSRIQRAGFDTLQAATVDDAALIERRGYVNVAQALEANPLFGTSVSGVGNSQSVSNTGARFVNMFSLGSQRTLTLVNGRRFVSGNSANTGGGVSGGSQVDLNLIPAGLVDRVETIAIGGAPIYGSDAIAGTVNIILKDKFEGLQLSALSGINEDGDSSTYTVRALAGKNFADGRGNIVLSGEYTKQSGLLYRDRFGEFKTLVDNPADQNSTDGISATRVIDNYRFAVFTEGGLPYFDSGAAGLLGFDAPGLSLPPFGIAPNGNYIFDSTGKPLQFDRTGNLVAFNPGETIDDLLAPTGLGTLPFGTKGGDGFSLADNSSLLTPTERWLGNAMGHFQITPDVRVFFEGAYAHSSTVRLSDLTNAIVPGLVGGPTITFSVNNPFLSAQARSILVANGLTTFNLNRNLNDIVQRRPQRTTQNMYRMVGGFDGHLDVAGERWNWNVSYNYGRIHNVSQITYIDPTRFLAAINAVAGPGGTIVCGGVAPPAGCAPLNLFGFGAASKAAADYVSMNGRADSRNTQTVLTANLGGKLPFGIASEPIAFNIGVERRTEKAVFDPNAVLQAGSVLTAPGLGAYAPVSGKFATKEVYGELVVPLVSEGQDFPLIRSAELEGSIRYVDHSIAGGATTWSAGGRLAPRLGGIGEGLSFRGVYTRAIRSPSVTELFTGTSPTTNRIADPCSSANFDRGNNPTARTANCAAALAAVGAPAPGTFVQTTDVRSVTGALSGNRALDNEKANSWSAGVTYQPPAIRGLHLAADWTDIKLTGGIQQLDINSVLSSCYDSPAYPAAATCAQFRRLTQADITAGNGTGGVASRKPGDIASGFGTTFFNSATLHFSGLIIAADYGFRLSGSAVSGEGVALRFGTKAFYTHRYTVTDFVGSEPAEVSGTVGQPKWKVQANLGASIGPADFDLQMLWRDKTRFSNTATFEDTPINNVAAYTLVNATLGFRVAERLKFQMVINNLLDRDVPYEAIVNGGYGAFDILGRSYLFTATANF